VKRAVVWSRSWRRPPHSPGAQYPRARARHRPDEYAHEEQAETFSMRCGHMWPTRRSRPVVLPLHAKTHLAHWSNILASHLLVPSPQPALTGGNQRVRSHSMTRPMGEATCTESGSFSDLSVGAGPCACPANGRPRRDAPTEENLSITGELNGPDAVGQGIAFPAGLCHYAGVVTQRQPERLLTERYRVAGLAMM
jgi:hypothetical protein